MANYFYSIIAYYNKIKRLEAASGKEKDQERTRNKQYSEEIKYQTVSDSHIGSNRIAGKYDTR